MTPQRIDLAAQARAADDDPVSPGAPDERPLRRPARRPVRSPRVRAARRSARRSRPSGSRSCCPTTTWQAYNYYDRNGDGFGDTWYSLWAQKRIDLDRARTCAVACPSAIRSYDVQFLHWLASRGHAVDTYADEDIDAVPDARRRCERAYDLIVFPGHTEYVTQRLYDLVERYRDLGGRLMFLSANNFFRRVVRSGTHARADRRVARRRHGPSRPCSEPSTSRTTAASGSSPSPSPAPTRPPGRSPAPASRTAPSSAYGIEIDATTPVLAARNPGPRPHPRPLRPRPLGRDDLLRNASRSTRLLRGRPQLRRHRHALARDRATPRQRLGAAGCATCHRPWPSP